jgi:hypothetical protein
MSKINLTPFKGEYTYQLDCRCEFTPKYLICEFSISGDLDSIVFEETLEPIETHDLWEKTCLEVFIRQKNNSSYFESNFSTNHDWKYFQYQDYRELDDKKIFSSDWQPLITSSHQNSKFLLTAKVPIQLILSRPLEITPTAVILDKAGKHHYFAPTHLKDTPDFHSLCSENCLSFT